MAIVLVQRQTRDWLRLSDSEFHQQSIAFCALWGKPPDYVWRLFQLWNQTFSVDYRSVRAQLKQVALANIQSARDVEFVPYQGYDNIPQQQGYYLFLDDDDWVDPQIAAHLQQHLNVFSSAPPLLLWRSANMGSPQQEHVVFVWGQNGRCMTNNYAVHGSFLQPFSRIHEVLQHKDAAVLFERATGVPHLDGALTVSNKSPISSVSLDRGLQGELKPERLIALVENYLERMRKVEDIELVYIPWSRSLIDQTIHLFDQVLRSRR